MSMTSSTSAQIMIRPGYGDDAQALARLAALDSAAVPSAPLLLAEADGVLRAALSTADGTAIADPFYRSARLVTLLRAHAEQDRLASGVPARRPAHRLRRSPRPRLAHS